MLNREFCLHCKRFVFSHDYDVKNDCCHRCAYNVESRRMVKLVTVKQS